MMKLTQLSLLLVAAMCLDSALARGEEHKAAKPEAAVTLVIPHEGDEKIPRVPRVNRREGNLLHAQVVLRNLAGRKLNILLGPGVLGPWVEMKAADGKSWVRLTGDFDLLPILGGPGRTIPPGGNALVDVYFNNYVLGAEDKKFTGRVTLRVVYDESQGGASTAGLWTGAAVSAPVECVIE